MALSLSVCYTSASGGRRVNSEVCDDARVDRETAILLRVVVEFEGTGALIRSRRRGCGMGRLEYLPVSVLPRRYCNTAVHHSDVSILVLVRSFRIHLTYVPRPLCPLFLGDRRLTSLTPSVLVNGVSLFGSLLNSIWTTLD